MIITFNITAKVRSKKNGKQIKKFGGRLMVVSSEDYIMWERRTRMELLTQMLMLEGEGVTFPIKGNTRMIATFDMAGKQHEPDLSNLLEGPQDIMQSLGIIENDRQITEIHCFKRMGCAQDLSIITLTPLEG